MLLPGLAMPLIFYWLHPPEAKQTPHDSQMALHKLAALGKLNRNEGIMLLVFLLLLWADIPALFIGDWVTLNTTT
ncbi:MULTISPECIES: anion permease [Halomonadaceae]|uniref:Uncharacterized protein n=2 Tax=root TaxID=1 RepID=A0AAP9NR57_9GAMM|nr:MULTISPECIES: anion permease [Halomonas]QKS25522.1 hypothetical protein FX987_03318 [Halomonas titanicae]CDG53279.1 hypothetical protein HALA3H3_490063 [Halomonas sp. A3H3]SDJ09573.1 Sodium:sulfate symporter transmembrane region [Halomonas titanicae]|tara:strand:- start:1997 stop:2221 length:225 start_codon:yes stop_codon:yes gene_type:complete